MYDSVMYQARKIQTYDQKHAKKHPVPASSAKLSNKESSQYLDEWNFLKMEKKNNQMNPPPSPS